MGLGAAAAVHPGPERNHYLGSIPAAAIAAPAVSEPTDQLEADPMG